MEVQICSQNFDVENAFTLEVAKAHGAYSSLEKLASMQPMDVVNEVEASILRGKGGGGGPAGKKWKTCLAYKEKHGYDTSYLLVNGDESEPGTFKDRYILARDPHLLIEGMIIGAYALGAKRAYVYIRGEYTLEFERVKNAMAEAYAANIVGPNSKFKVDVAVYKGAGAYICGEKSAQLNSLEGYRGMPRLKPQDRGEPDFLYHKPCVVNNVETISTLPYIVRHGASGYKKMGTEKSPGGMIFGCSGHINNPCIKELAFGMPLLEFIETYGGGVWKGKKLKAVIPGGSSCPVLTAEEAKSAILAHDDLKAIGSALGTGGMIVMDEDTDMVKALVNLIDFYKEESCGQCTPCREGSYYALTLVENIYHGHGKESDIDALLDVSTYINGTTVCVFAPALSDVIKGFVTKFRDEFMQYIKAGK